MFKCVCVCVKMKKKTTKRLLKIKLCCHRLGDAMGDCVSPADPLFLKPNGGFLAISFHNLPTTIHILGI